MHLPMRLPEPTQQELDGAQNVLLMYGLGFASEHFESVLSPETRAVVEDVQKNLVDKLLNAMVSDNGQPSTALVEEIKRQMRDLQKNTGTTDDMPAPMKQLVATSGIADGH